MNNGSSSLERAPQTVDRAGSLSSEAILAQLRRIVSNEEFGASQQLCRFLTYIVEQTLLGKSDDLKAYTIALEVLDRGADFNPQLDSVVRVRARRLRQALERYYLTAGSRDPIRIDVPKGSYVPTFQKHNRTLSPLNQI